MSTNLKTSPKDFFLWLAATAALYVSVTSFVALWFEYINRLVGTDELGYYADPFSTGIRIAVASLIIIFPLYLWLMRMLNKDMRAHAEKRELWVRKWSLGLTLFIGAIILVIDLIVLINTFLGGEEITTAFLLKILTILIVVGGTFTYYVFAAKGYSEKKERESKAIASGVGIAVLASIVSAFFIIGTPQELRMIRYDQQKVTDLQNIQWQITDYYRQKETLPPSLESLNDPLVGFSVPVDPQASEGNSYEYRIVSAEERTFELCATFNTEDMGDDQTSRALYGDTNEHWKHGAGEICFERTIDPERLGITKEPIPIHF